MSRPKANSDFFKTWSKDMAYILGFIVTDGCLVEHKNGYNALNITNKNKGILEIMLKAMNSNHKVSVKPRGGNSDRKYFQIQIRDRSIYGDLLKLGLMPRKSKKIRMPEVPTEFLGDFIRGCFDGDGSINVWQDPRWRHPWQTRAVFSSGNRAFLSDMQSRLYEKADLSNGSIQKGTRVYALCYSITDSIKLYNFMYRDQNGKQLYITAKRKKFEFFKSVRPELFN